MKIVHVVTLASPDGAFGGPIRVALNQARGLIQAGHDVTLLAAYLGDEDAIPQDIDGVPAKLFVAKRLVPGSGFVGLWSTQLFRRLAEETQSADILHIHMGRHLITLLAAAQLHARKRPYVVQTHGMVTPSAHPLAAPLDALLTRRSLRGASRVFFLNRQEETDLQAVAGNGLRLQHLRNGVPFVQPKRVERSDRIEVLFLARLHKRKRPLEFLAMAERLRDRFPQVRFTLVGPDEGEGPRVKEIIQQMGMGDRLTWEGPLHPAKTMDRMRQAHIYVLPAVNEPFGMTVVEAMSAGLPVVVTESCGLADAIKSCNAGYVANETVGSLADAVATLLEDASKREAAGQRAAEAAASEFGMGGVIADLEAAYADSIAHSSSRAGRR